MTPAAATDGPTKAQFADQIESTFRACAPGGQQFEMSLAEFHDILDSDTQETFSVLFRAPADLEAEQGTYTLSNSGLGEQTIFLVPVKRDESGLYFEAIYNRFKR